MSAVVYHIGLCRIVDELLHIVFTGLSCEQRSSDQLLNVPFQEQRRQEEQMKQQEEERMEREQTMQQEREKLEIDVTVPFVRPIYCVAT